MRFTGSRFRLLGRGVEDRDAANRITAADVLAVGLLNVTISGPVVLELLEGRLGEDLAALLAKIPVDVESGTATAVALAPDSPASRPWTRLERTPGLGWVSATKLLARTRPLLIPVSDRVVRCALDTHAGPWLWLNHRLAENEGRVSSRSSTRVVFSWATRWWSPYGSCAVRSTREGAGGAGSMTDHSAEMPDDHADPALGRAVIGLRLAMGSVSARVRNWAAVRCPVLTAATIWGGLLDESTCGVLGAAAALPGRRCHRRQIG